jgi:hypothetical protein
MIYGSSPEERWKVQKSKLRLLFPHLGDEDFQYDYARKENMMANLQAKLGKTREELNYLIALL